MHNLINITKRFYHHYLNPMISNSYYKFEPLNTFGVFSTSHYLEYLALDAQNEGENSKEKMKIVPHLIMPCVSSLNFLNTRTQEIFSIVTNHSIITAFIIVKKSLIRFGETVYEHLAVLGYRDGTLKIYDMKGECLLTTKAHKTEITVITCDRQIDAQYLFLGSNDTDISIFNLVSMEPSFLLRGHKNAVTGLVYIPQDNVLISSSKDMLIKVWELDTQHCVQTLVDTQHEIWSIKANPSLSRLLVGCTDTELRVLDLNPLTRPSNDKKTYVYERMIQFMGPLHRKSKERILSMEWDNYGETIAVFGASDNVIELFVLRTPEEKEEYLKIQTDQLNKEYNKRKNAFKNNITFSDELEDEEDRPQTPEEWYQEKLNELKHSADIEFKSIAPLKLPHPVRSLKFAPFDQIQRDINSKKQFRLAVITTANTLSEYDVKISGQHKKILDLKEEGHTSSVLSLMISYEKNFIATASKNEFKLWNYKNGKSFRNVKVPQLQCASLLPGEQYAVAGTREGSLLVLDLNTSLIVETVEKAHLREIWSVNLTPDGRGLITGSSDKSVKLWGLVVKEDDSGASFVGIEHEHTLQMTDDVQTTVASTNGKFVAIALLDNTVKIFYLDSFKFYLVLYGHSLPVNALDISSDETLIVTGSSDKTIKIWGLDFGDCHKSFIAHGGPVTSVKFVKDTHYFVSCSKDGSIKKWDADNYELIQVLRDPFANSALVTLDISSDGSLIATSGHERAIYVYEETDEILYLEEEKEKRMEEEFEKDLPKSQQFQEINIQKSESTVASQRTIESIHDGERLIEVLDIAIEEDRKWEEYTEAKKKGLLIKVPDQNPLLMKMSVEDYVWFYLKKIRRSEILNVLSVLSYSHASYILTKLEILFYKQRIDIELASKIVFSLTRIHQNTLFKDVALFKLIYKLNRAIKHDLYLEKDVIGFNTAALGLVRRRLQNEKELLTINEVAQRSKLQYTTTYRRSKKEQERIQKEKEKLNANQTVEFDELLGHERKRPRLSKPKKTNESDSSDNSDSDSSNEDKMKDEDSSNEDSSNEEINVKGYYEIGDDEDQIKALVARLTSDD